MGLSQKSLTQIEKKNVQGSYESLDRLEGKTGEGPFFKGSIWYNNSVVSGDIKRTKVINSGYSEV